MSVILQQQRFAKVRRTRLCTQITRQVGQACICQLFLRMRNKLGILFAFSKISYFVPLWILSSHPGPCPLSSGSWVVEYPQRSRVLTPTPPSPSEILEKARPSWSYHSTSSCHTSLGLTLEWSEPKCVCKVSDCLWSRTYLIKTWLNAGTGEQNHH